MQLSSLGSVFRTPLQSPPAVPLGGAVGAVVGAGFAAAFQHIANAGPGAVFGLVLGAGWTFVMQRLDRREHPLCAGAPGRALGDYPEVCDLLRNAGRSHRDAEALRQISLHLGEHIDAITAQFNTYCAFRRLVPHPLIGPLIRHFFLTHCATRGVVLISKRSMSACYLVAAHHRDKARMVVALNDGTVPAGTVFRQLRCPYMRLDLANLDLGSARECITEECNGEWKVRPLPVPFEVSPLVEVTRRRTTGQHVPSPAPVSPTLVDAPVARPGATVTITRGPRLRKRLAELALPPDSRTWRELNRIEEDLAAQRPCGHPITHKGKDYMSCDIHLDGRWAPGRNKWRLLYWRVPGGFRLEDIDDTHGPRA